MLHRNQFFLISSGFILKPKSEQQKQKSKEINHKASSNNRDFCLNSLTQASNVCDKEVDYFGWGEVSLSMQELISK